MVRRKYVPYPLPNFDKEKVFDINDFPFPSIFDILYKSDSEIIEHYQNHNLVHKFCPHKKCCAFEKPLVLSYRCNKKGSLACPICKEEYPSRPSAFQNLSGDHKTLFTELYAFSLQLNADQSKKLLGTGKDKNRDFRKRMHSVIITALEKEDVQLGGGVCNPVAVDEMQKGRRRVGNGKQGGHATTVHGDVFGACDNERYRFTMQAKPNSGPPRFEQIEDDFKNWLLPESLVYSDGAKAYIKFQDQYPHLVQYLVQLNHSVGQWTKKVKVEGKNKKATTNKIDGSWSHLRRFFSNHMVSQANAFRYLKEFEFFFGTWSKNQNSFERLLYCMQLQFDINNIEGPELLESWKDRSKGNILDF